MPRFKILSKEEIKEFDTPSEFTSAEKEKYFVIDHKNNEILDKIKSFDNKVAFILVCGYFNAYQKFFTPDKFYASDVEFVTSLVSAQANIDIDFSHYTENNFWRHKKIVSDIYGYRLFSDLDQTFFEEEIGPVKLIRYEELVY